MARNIKIGDVSPASCRCLQLQFAAAKGFTLVELMIVIFIMMILLSVAAPRYTQSIQRAKEATLRQNLYTLRTVIDQYTMDKQRAPQSLDDLVSAGYLRQIPRDPIANTTEWEVVTDETVASIDQQESGITDVHSTAQQLSLEGTAYNTW
jgi:general secretion pathway protein G